MSAPAAMDFRWKEFMTKMDVVRRAMKEDGEKFIRMNARRLVKKWAYLAPIKTGRLRAGFWPAAISLGMNTVYTPLPNQGEGIGVANLKAANPHVRIANTVPYVANAGNRGTSWWWAGLRAVEVRMREDLDKYVRGTWNKGAGHK